MYPEDTRVGTKPKSKSPIFSVRRKPMAILSGFGHGLYRVYRAYLDWVNNLSDRYVEQNAAKLTNKTSEVIARWSIKVGFGMVPIAIPLLVLLILLPSAPKSDPVEVSGSTTQPATPDSSGVGSSAPVETTDSTVVPEPQSEPGSTPESVVKAEHRNQPTYVKDTWDQYMVLLEPVGNLGQLSMQIVIVNSEERVPVVSNCIDLLQKGKDADLQLGQAVGIEETFKDYSDWIYTAARSFCNESQGGTTIRDSNASQTSTAQVSSTTAEASQQSSIKRIVQAGDGYANLRSQPSTEVAAIAQINNGTEVTVLGEQTNGSGQLWYRVEVNGQTGWMFSGLLRSPEAADSSTELEDMPEQAISSGSSTVGAVRTSGSGKCDYPWQTDSRGRRCGARAASNRPSGR